MPIQKSSFQDKVKNLEINKVIHEPARLKIMTLLYLVEAGDMVFLKDQSGLTWGNLSVQVTRLENAGYVDIQKEFIENKPHTLVTLTGEGREAFKTYSEDISRLLK